MGPGIRTHLLTNTEQPTRQLQEPNNIIGFHLKAGMNRMVMKDIINQTRTKFTGRGNAHQIFASLAIIKSPQLKCFCASFLPFSAPSEVLP